MSIKTTLAALCGRAGAAVRPVLTKAATTIAAAIRWPLRRFYAAYVTTLVLGVPLAILWSLCVALVNWVEEALHDLRTAPWNKLSRAWWAENVKQ